jgi:hypothetical protein
MFLGLEMALPFTLQSETQKTPVYQSIIYCCGKFPPLFEKYTGKRILPKKIPCFLGSFFF